MKLTRVVKNLGANNIRKVLPLLCMKDKGRQWLSELREREKPEKSCGLHSHKIDFADVFVLALLPSVPSIK